MKERNNFMKKISLVFALLLIIFTMLPMNVSAKTKSSKTVKIYSFSSGDAQVDKKVRSIIKKKIKPNMTTAQQVKAIHDYIVLNCQYDYKNYLNGTIPIASYSPRGVLINKKAVCQGYAETFKLFMDALNIPCKFVRGATNGGGHGWNMVQINNKWYHIDVTWDDPVPDEKGRLRYNYFLIPDSKMDDDHVWNKAIYPKCTSSSNKFLKLVFKKNVSKTLKQAKNNFYKEYTSNKNKECTVIVPKKLYKKSKNLIGILIDSTQEKCSEHIFSSTYSTTQYGDYYILNIKVLYAEPKEAANSDESGSDNKIDEQLIE